MLDKAYYWIGQRANMLIALLAIVVAANVLFQAYTHKTTPLLAWKGGGFGMYTEPHAEDRSVWVNFRGAEGSASVRLWPITPEFSAWQDKGGVRGSAFLTTMTKSADRLRYYPRASQANDLVGLTARVRWPEEVVGDVRPSEGKVFKPADITLTVYENRYDVQAQQVERSAVFTLRGGQN